MKKRKADKMIIRSSQSAFSRAVMSCLEVSMRELRESWVCEVARSIAVESSRNNISECLDVDDRPYRASEW